MSINLKNINECFELLKYRMKINNYKCHNKKQTDKRLSMSWADYKNQVSASKLPQNIST
jgi:hypothetical protein